jgi:acyl-CoA thioesterase FadM
MNMYLRLMLLWLSNAWSRSAKACGILDETVLQFTCGLADIDLYRHMNNAKYLSFMDLGRIHFIMSIGASRLVKSQRWFTIVGGSDIQYRRAIGPFKRFQLKTRLLAWDERWFYHEQTFVVDEKISAVGHVKVLLLGPDKKVVKPADALSMLGIDIESPLLPDSFVEWNAIWDRKPRSTAKAELVQQAN